MRRLARLVDPVALRSASPSAESPRASLFTLFTLLPVSSPGDSYTRPRGISGQDRRVPAHSPALLVARRSATSHMSEFISHHIKGADRLRRVCMFRGRIGGCLSRARARKA